MCLGEVLLFEWKVPREGFLSDTVHTAAKWPIRRVATLSPNRNLSLMLAGSLSSTDSSSVYLGESLLEIISFVVLIMNTCSKYAY